MTQHEEITALADEVAQAYKEAGEIHMKETQAYIETHGGYHSKTDYDKAHTKTIAQMVAEHLISLGYHRENVGVPAPLCDPPDTF